MSSGVVDVCLIPEVTFSLDKLCDYIQSVMEKKVNPDQSELQIQQSVRCP